jgi:4-amino-4-deoxy-L-arabinose transferase-like glycosyltransferase
LPAIQAARPAAPRPWRERPWRERLSEQDDWAWLLVLLAALLAIRLLALVLARTDLFFDEAQYWTWSRELDFGYFSKPPLIAWIIRRLATDVCGNAEWCVRAPSAVLYTITSVFVFLAGRALYDNRIGFWSALVFATLPAAAFSSLVISTDVPLLACWTLALYAWIKLVQSQRFVYALLVGAALGLGLLAKYAAIYFLLCVAIDARSDKRARAALGGGRGIVALAISLTLIAPNLFWNATHSFATFSHTAENAGWKELPIHLSAGLAFLGSQFAVFGPILFAVLIWMAWRALRYGCEEPQCRLLAFSMPVILLLVLQALLSRALANWAAAAYPAATILVTAELLRHWPRLFRISLGPHLGAALVITLPPIFAPEITKVTGPDWNPYARVLGWRDLAATTRRLAEQQGVKSVLTDNREVTGELLYYLRDTSLPVLIWWRGEPPRNQFEITHPFTASAPEPLLYVTLNTGRTSVPKRFGTAKKLETPSFTSDTAPRRERRFYLLRGYKSDHDH